MQTTLPPRLALTLCLLFPAANSRAQVIRGQVVGPDREPHAGARVELVADTLLRRGLPYRQREAVLAVSKTSARGHFAIDVSGMAPGISHSLFVVTDALADRRISGLTRPEGGEHNLGVLELRPGAPMTGTVVDSDQKPLAGVTVRWFPQPDEWADPRPYAPARDDGWSAQTDATGRFALANLPGGPGMLSAAKANFKADTRPTIARIENPWNAQLTLFPGESMRGVITDQNKKPVPGARVFVLMKSNYVRTSPCVITRADSQGRYVLPVPGDTPTTVFARAPGFVGTQTTPAPSSGGSLNLTLGTMSTIQVRVKTPEGEAVPWFAARLVSLQTTIAMTGFATGKTKEGLATVPAPGRGQFQVEVRVPGYAPSVSKPVMIGPRNTPQPVIEVTLDRGGAVRGQVVDAAGKPVPGAKLELRYGAVAFNARLTAMNLHWYDDQMIPFVADSEGRFVIKQLRAQAYVVYASHPKFVPTTARGTVENGETHDFKQLTLHRGATVHGTTTFQGKPAARIRVLLRSATTNLTVEAVSDAKGRFVLKKPMAPGRYLAMAASMPGDDATGVVHEFNGNLKQIEIPPEKADYTLDFQMK